MSQPNWNEDEFDLTLSQRTEELYRIPNREPDADGLIEAAVLPLRDMVIFPRMVSPLFIGRETSLLALQEAQRKELTVIGLTQKDPDLDFPGVGDFLPIGVELAVGRLLAMPDGSHSALVQGRRRDDDPHLRGVSEAADWRDTMEILASGRSIAAPWSDRRSLSSLLVGGERAASRNQIIPRCCIKVTNQLNTTAVRRQPRFGSGFAENGMARPGGIEPPLQE